MKSNYMEFYEYIRRYCREYLPCQRQLSSHTIRYYRDSLNRFIEYLKEKYSCTYQGLNLDMFTAENVSDFLDWLRIKGNKPSTINRRLAALKIFAQFVVMNDEILAGVCNKINKIRLIKTPQKLVEYLSLEQTQKLLMAPNIISKFGSRDRLLLILLYETAARESEIAQIKFSDFHETKEGISVTLTGKGNKTRIVPISNKVYNHVRQYRACSENDIYLFSTHSGHLSSASVYKLVRHYGQVVGIDGDNHLHPHILRHTRAMHWYQGGVSLELVSQLLGHAQMATTRIYAQADLEMKRAAINKANTASIPNAESNHDSFNWNDEHLLMKLCGLR